jgi:hypothetical protein
MSNETKTTEATPAKTNDDRTGRRPDGTPDDNFAGRPKRGSATGTRPIFSAVAEILGAKGTPPTDAEIGKTLGTEFPDVTLRARIDRVKKFRYVLRTNAKNVAAGEKPLNARLAAYSLRPDGGIVAAKK